MYYTIVFMLISISLLAQNKNTKVADKLFDRFEFVQAAQEYLSLVEKEIKTVIYVSNLETVTSICTILKRLRFGMQRQ